MPVEVRAPTRQISSRVPAVSTGKPASFLFNIFTKNMKKMNKQYGFMRILSPNKFLP
jgi:hypothetical protein